MSLASIIAHYRPFIRKHKKSVFLLVLGNVIQAIFIVIINTSFNLFFGLLVSGVYTPVGLCLALGQYLGSVAVLTFAAGINSYIGDKLIHSLNQEVTHSLLDKWMKTKAYFGANFIQSPKVINPAGALSYDIQESNRLAIRLGDNLLNTFFAFLAGLYGLWQLSFPLTFELGTLLLVIPGYLAIGALVYAVVYNIIASKIGYKLKDLTERNHTFFNKLEAQVHHVDKHAEGIELLKAAPYEKKKIDKILNKSTLSNTLISKLQGALIAFTALNEHLRFFAGILLSYPQILANKMTVDVLISVGDYFTRVAYFPSWKYEKYEDVTNLEVYIGKINALKAQIDDWNQIQQMNKLEITKGKTLSFKDLLVTKPDQSVILKSKQFNFKNGQLTLIQGPSGIGKSTLFRVMTQLWPYVKGKMTLPCEPIEVHVIPQKIVFPLNSTLYEAIHYPLDVAFKDLSLAQRQEMDALLLEFKLDKSVIEKASEKRDWSKILSGGEQQRIALIRAIVHKPKLLLMDEPYSALDPTLHEHCEKAILKYLKPYKTTIILIDHRSENQAQKSDGNRLQVDSVNFRNKMLAR